LLGGFNGRCFVEVSPVFYVQPLEGVGKLEDLILRKLRKLPIKRIRSRPNEVMADQHSTYL
jgi:hypothetical protein